MMGGGGGGGSSIECILLLNKVRFFKRVFVAQGPFCGATGGLCFRLRMTLLPMGFKARNENRYI